MEMCNIHVHVLYANDRSKAGTRKRKYRTIIWTVIYTFVNSTHLFPAMWPGAFINAISYAHQITWMFGALDYRLCSVLL